MLMENHIWKELKPVLKKVSRSFYLSLWILPARARSILALGYLLARSADTIADTSLLPAVKRRHWLGQLKKNMVDRNNINFEEFQSQLIGPQEIPEEKELLMKLSFLLEAYWEMSPADRLEIQKVLAALISGMEKDLQRFPDASSKEVRALETFQELDTYCFYAAGVVGPFWTYVLKQSFSPSFSEHENLESLSIDYGKGLQLINVVKDTARDYQNGRCYLPLEGLKALGLELKDLSHPESLQRLKPLVFRLIGRSLDYLEAAHRYLLHIPRRHYVHRLAALWPFWIGLATLEFLAQDQNLLSVDHPHKISKNTLTKLMIKSFLVVFSDKALERHYLMARDRIRRLITPENPNIQNPISNKEHLS